MARITIEDCMEHVPNRFHLVRMASIRAKQLKKGALPLLASDDNKHVVMSLREIAAGLVKPTDLEAPAEKVEAVAETIVEAAEAIQTEEAATEEVVSVVEPK
jgi:DNA-directed RNA polymerase subunit omega